MILEVVVFVNPLLKGQWLEKKRINVIDDHLFLHCTFRPQDRFLHWFGMSYVFHTADISCLTKILPMELEECEMEMIITI